MQFGRSPRESQWGAPPSKIKILIELNLIEFTEKQYNKNIQHEQHVVMFFNIVFFVKTTIQI